MADHEYGFRTRAIHAGNIPDPVTGARAAADLPDQRLRLRRHRGRRRPLRPAEVRQHLQPARQPDRRRVRGADRLPRGRARRRRDRIRARRRSSSPSPRSPEPATTSSRPRSLYGGSITQLDVTLRRFGVDTTFVRASDPADYAAAITDSTKLIFAETIANPSGDDRRPRGPRRRRARGRRAADRRLDGRDAVPQPADRVGRRHRHPLRDEVPRRPRHHARRRRRRDRPLPLGERALPAVRRSPCPPTAASTGRATSASTPSSPACAPSSCATSARCSRRTPRSCSRRASRRCRSGCRRTSTTPAPSPSGWTPTPASSP